MSQCRAIEKRPYDSSYSCCTKEEKHNGKHGQGTWEFNDKYLSWSCCCGIGDCNIEVYYENELCVHCLEHHENRENND